MSSSDDYFIEILTAIPVYLNQYVGPIFYVIGNIGNLLSLFIFFKKAWRKNVCVFYLVIYLITSTIFVNSALIGSIFTLGYNIHLENSNVILCKVFYYVTYLCSTYLPLVLILASIDRLLISSQNVDTRLYSSKRLAYFAISASIFIWSVFSLHVLIKVSIQPILPPYFLCYYDFSKSYLDFFVYSALVMYIVTSLFMIILSIIAFQNVRRIRAIPRQQRGRVRTMNKKDFQLLRCLYIHNIVYIISSLVLGAGIVYGTSVRYQPQTSMEQAVANFLNNFGSVLHYIPYCASFFIFICVSKAFRQELKRLAYKICCKDFAIAREEENKQQELPRDAIELNGIVSTVYLPS